MDANTQALWCWDDGESGDSHIRALLEGPPGSATALPTSGAEHLGPYRGAEPFHVRPAGGEQS